MVNKFLINIKNLFREQFFICGFSKLFSYNIIKLFTGFSIIGVINTVIHTIIVIFLIEIFKIYSVYANIIGFITANIFSFLANSKWNFKTDVSFVRYAKFLIVSMIGLLVTISMSYLAVKLKLHYIFGLIFIYITMPIITFILHYKWTWKTQKEI